jgi:exodeoxyribonuclease VII large subunit
MREIPANAVLTVSGLTELIRDALEETFAEVWVQGEISNFRRQESGHCYFSLKDEGAQLSCVLFRGDAARLAQPLRDGMRVNAFGRIGVYAPRGSYQLVCRNVLAAGKGTLAERFEALKKRLADEGLFAKEKKKPLPVLPRSLAIVTSPTGAVIRDFLSILSRRGWRGRVVLFPVRVQGAGAAQEIAAAVQKAGKCGIFDAVVLARGGGSLEDLWPFNEEAVVRAVAACPVPTVSGVGHETDFTLCDFAADLRAETPSAAAELISSLRLDARDRVSDTAERLEALAGEFLATRRARLDLAGAKLAASSPQRRVEHLFLRLDELSTRMGAFAGAALASRRSALEQLAARSHTAGPARRAAVLAERLDQIALRLASVSPQSAVRRGYAIVRNAQGGILTNAARALAAREVTLEMRGGTLEAAVRGTSPADAGETPPLP